MTDTAMWTLLALSTGLSMLSLASSIAVNRRLTELRTGPPAPALSAARDDQLPGPGHRIAPFTALSVDGAPVSEASLDGGTSLVGFFLAGCEPCEAQLTPYRRRAEDSGLATDRVFAVVAGDTSAERAGYVRQLAGTGMVVEEGRAVVNRAFGVRAFPAFCLVRDGAVVAAATSVDELDAAAHLSHRA